MPAMTAIAISALRPFGRALVATGARAGRTLKRWVQLSKNRRAAKRLAALDDHMLADIGLTRSDLRDAYAEPVWRDSSDVLAERARERRNSRRRFPTGPSNWHIPPTNRPARQAM
jgi:uncharacterized protein YjiS (DUF1127 family)